MKKTIIVCDLCNHQIHRDENEATFLPNLTKDNYDVCDDCLEIVYKAISKNVINWRILNNEHKAPSP